MGGIRFLLKRLLFFEIRAYGLNLFIRIFNIHAFRNSINSRIIFIEFTELYCLRIILIDYAKYCIHLFLLYFLIHRPQQCSEFFFCESAFELLRIFVENIMKVILCMVYVNVQIFENRFNS